MTSSEPRGLCSAVPDGGLERGDWAWLLSLLAMGCVALGAFAITASRIADAPAAAGPSLSNGVPLDDAWIHFQFARNLAGGDGFAFNPGDPTAGSTAPLWTVLLAGLYAVGGRLPLSGQILSAVCLLFTIGATYALAKRLTRSRELAWLAGAVVAVNGRMVWVGLSALETCLFAALSLVAVSSHLSDRREDRVRMRTAALLGITAMARPEGYLLFALAMTDHGLRALTSRSPKRWLLSRVAEIVAAMALFAGIVAPYLIFSLRSAGHLLPNTFSAKATFNLRPDLDFLSLAARYLILDNPVLLPFFVLGIGPLWTRGRLLSVWVVGLPLVYAFLHAVLYQHGRYLMPLIPLNGIAGVVGLLEARRLAQRRGFRWPRSQRLPRALAAGVIVLATAWRLPTMARHFAWNVDNINRMHVAIGEWMAENTPPDAVLALNDIGAITYVSRREVVDLAGLVTPEVVPILRAPDGGRQLLRFMAERSVDYVAIFPTWFPSLAGDDRLTPVHRVTLERRTITGGRTMVVYRATWENEAP